jgi:hypothetical protein
MQWKEDTLPQQVLYGPVQSSRNLTQEGPQRLKMLWTRYFLMNQGFNVGPSRILKDNKSAMLLEENGMESSSKQPCHIHISFYFVTDQVHLNNVTIEHCPTKSIVADFFTKPLQGSAFYEFRKAIMELPY